MYQKMSVNAFFVLLVQLRVSSKFPKSTTCFSYESLPSGNKLVASIVLSIFFVLLAKICYYHISGSHSV